MNIKQSTERELDIKATNGYIMLYNKTVWDNILATLYIVTK